MRKLKETILNELQEKMMKMSWKIGNINKEKNYFKRIKIKYSLEGLKKVNLNWEKKESANLKIDC